MDGEKSTMGGFLPDVYYKLGAVESQLIALNATLSRHVAVTDEQNKALNDRLTSLEQWRTQVNARAGALGAVVGTIASVLVVIADKYLIPFLGKLAGGI